jgi:hypothetical protein
MPVQNGWEKTMANWPDRRWWFSVAVSVFGGIGGWYGELIISPSTDGVVGGIIGFSAGSFLSLLVLFWPNRNSN